MVIGKLSIQTPEQHLQELWDIAKRFVQKEYPNLDANQKRITILATVNQLIEIEKLK